MNQVYTLDRDFLFKSKIYEITSISVEQNFEVKSSEKTTLESQTETGEKTTLESQTETGEKETIIEYSNDDLIVISELVDLDEQTNTLENDENALDKAKELFKNRGYILHVASIASFEPGPLMATYYATKSYVYNLSTAINYELKKSGSKVYVGCLCPGPVDTEFNKIAKVRFNLASHSSEFVCSYALKQMFKGKKIIIPSLKIKLAYIASKFLKVNILSTIRVDKNVIEEK